VLQPFAAPRPGLIHLCSQFIALALELRAQLPPPLPRTSTHPRLPFAVILNGDHLWNKLAVGRHPRLRRRERDGSQQP
jgi:hypothetical protein